MHFCAAGTGSFWKFARALSPHSRWLFVRVREDKSELVSRTAITVPRGSTPTDVARTAVKSKSNNEEWDRLSVFPATANAFMSSDEPVSRSVDVPMDQELDSLVEANHPFPSAPVF